MFVANKKNLPQRRAAAERKNNAASVADLQELVTSLMEQNAILSARNEELVQQVADMQEAVSSLNANA